MADSSVAGPIAAVLKKTEPFVLDKTIENLESLSGSAVHQHCPLPLGSNPGNGSGDDGDRPFLETFFNRSGSDGYRSPGKNGHPNANDPEVVELEESANDAWNAYRQLYYGNDAVGSVFVRRKDGASSSSSSPAKKKGKGGGALEALFGIRKTVAGEYEVAESARWESVHLVTIEAPNLEAKTCEYQIRSTVWCRYQPSDVGDVPLSLRKNPEPSPPKKPEPPKPKGRNAKVLDITRLEIFDKAADNWNNHHNNNKNKKAPKPKPKGPPVPATVTSSALYTVETTKTCGIASSAKSASVPAAQHIRNIGTIIEKVEADLRSKVERVDAPRCFEVLQGMYRPTLSPGLKLPNGTASGQPGSMISRLGGHATGMGVGKSLIGEISNRAQSMGLGGDQGGAKSGSSVNKAMEGILAAEKKRLVASSSTSTSPVSGSEISNLRAGLKSSGGSLRKVVPAPPVASADAAVDLRAGLKKTNSATRVAEAAQTQPTPEFMNFRGKLKKSAPARS